MEKDELLLLADLNYVEAMREQTRRSGGTVVEEDGLVLMAGPHPYPMVNIVERTGPRLTANEIIQRANRFFEDCDHGYTLILREWHEDTALEEAALEVGLIPVLSTPEMVVEQRLPDKPAPEGSVIKRVVDMEGVRDYAKASSQAWKTYGMPEDITAALFAKEESLVAPHIVAVVAYLDGAPVSCALVLASHGIAGVFWVGTTEEARGRGLGEACTREVTNIGFDLGARFVSLQATPMGEPIYRRMGYVDFSKYNLFITPTHL